jgi:hypothetical protein
MGGIVFGVGEFMLVFEKRLSWEEDVCLGKDVTQEQSGKEGKHIQDEIYR